MQNILKKNLLSLWLIVIVFSLVSLTASISVSAFSISWTNNPNNCKPANSTDLYNGQSCYPNGQVFCGLMGANVQCADLANVTTAPASNATSSTIYSGGNAAGYIVNCLATADATSPYCNNNGAYWCNADATCLNTNHRITQCNSSLWSYQSSAYTCTNSCTSGFYDCNGGVDCDIQNGSACSFLPGIDGTYICSADAGGSCRSAISGGGSAYTCTCTPEKSFFETGTNTAYSTTDPLLWGTQYSTGDLINMGNASIAEVFNVDNNGLLTTTNATVNTMRIAFNDGVGTVGLYSINTNPDGTLAGNKGSLAMDYVNGKVYVNINGGTDWNQLLDDSTALGGPTYTISTGLTDASGTLTANISTGVSGGQTIYGGTGSGDNLTIDSTTNATKGNILLNPNGGNVGIGTNNPADFALQVNGDIGPDNIPQRNIQFATVDSTGQNGLYSNIVIGFDGLPIISYYDWYGQDLEVAKCNNANCSDGSYTVTKVDTEGGSGQDSDMAIGLDGYPVISYRTSIDMVTYLKVAKCVNASCTGISTINTLVTTAVFGISIAVPADGFPVISYIGGNNSDLMVAKCSDISCTNPPTITSVFTPGNMGLVTELRLGNDGYPYIISYDSSNSIALLTKCQNNDCSTSSTTQIDGSLNVRIDSVIPDMNGGLVMSGYHYINKDLIYIRCSDFNCVNGVISRNLDNVGDVGNSSNILIGLNGDTIITYPDTSNQDVIVMYCTDITCAESSDRIVLPLTGNLYGPSAVIDNNGDLLISFINMSMSDLVVATVDDIYTGGSNLGSTTKYFNNTYSANYFAKNSISISNFDLAEDYKVSDTSIVAGDVVSMSKSGGILVDKTSEAYSNNVLGVISTSPGLKLSDWNLSEEERQNMRPVALAGRVPVKVSTENGNIEIGDYLVPATKAGYAMKQCGTKYCNPGISIGRALESFTYKNGGDSNGVKVELQEVKEEVKIIEQEVQNANVTNEEKEAVRVAVEATEDIIKPMALEQYGEGRIMMFVDLGYRLTPELSNFLSGQYKSNTSGDDTTMMTNLNSNSILANDIQNIKFDNLTVVDLNVTGLLTANSISTSLISSIGQNAIEFKLGDSEGISKFKITNSVGGYLFGINSKGVFEFGKDNPSRGQTTIPAGSTELKVSAEGVNKDSIILLTLISNMDENQTLKLSSQGDGYFIVRLNTASEENLKFNWWYSN